ncbi:MAG TPA: hypothetical protein VF116_01075 [Ktedonobacterales bacterium]
MRAQTLLFTTLLRALVVCIFLLLVLLDVSRSLWIDLAGLAFTGALLLAVIGLALRRRRPSCAGRPPAAPTDSSPSATPRPRGM